MRRLAHSLGLGSLVALIATACSGNFDTTREARPYADKATLGQEVFGVICDRIGAGALNEDPMGISFHAVCHPDASGKYADAVDVSRLPPVTGSAAVTRNLAVAKVEALARKRSDLVRALDVILPDIQIDDPYPPKDANGNAVPAKVGLHHAVKILIQRLDPLYDSNPLASSGASSAPLLPSATQSLARVFQALIDSKQAQDAFSGIGGRKGYRPLAVGFGALKPVLLYPDLRSLSQQSVRILSPGGAARTEFVQLLNVVHQELRTAETELPLGPVVVDEDLAQPNRPRDNLEIMQKVLLASDPAFAGDAQHMGLIVLRDYRGFAHVAGSIPGLAGSVPAPFSDTNGDGLADIDAFGRFAGADGLPVQVDLPFSVPDEPRFRPPDAMGRAVFDDGNAAYEYIDTNETLVASLLRDLTMLVDPDPANDRETLMDALAGAYVLFGDRNPGQTREYGDDKVWPKKPVKYDAFKPETSPLVDLVYAMGQVMADPQSDDYLQQMIDLFENHEQEMARLIGAALEMKAISDGYPDVSLRAESTIWDEMMDLVTKICAKGPSSADGKSLLEDLLLALGDDRSLALGSAYSKFATYRDVIMYDQSNLNGPTYNRSSSDYQPPHIPVDRTKPITGDNRSALMRSLQIIYDSTGTTACNKAEAHVHLKTNVPIVGKMEMTYPDDALFGFACSEIRDPIPECGVYRIDNLTEFYLQSLIEDDPELPASRNKHRAQLVVNDPCLNYLAAQLNLDMDDTFEQSSQITGLTTSPTHMALNRLVFFGADSTKYAGLPDLDPSRLTNNETTARFITGLQDPIGSRVCPKNANGVNDCASPDDLLRIRNPGTLFLWEQFGFGDANRPVLGAFYDHDAEGLFAEAIDVLHRHWADDTHGPECSNTGTWRPGQAGYNAKWCSEDGVVRYEPILAAGIDPNNTEIVKALHDFARVLRDQKIESRRYRTLNGVNPTQRRGSEVIAAMTRALVDSNYAASQKITDRSGERSTLWSDGVTVKGQVTPFDLLANALKRIDARFDTAAGFSPEDREARKLRWKKARSKLVDQFLAVDGKGNQAKFRNPAAPKAIVHLLKTLREQLNVRCPDRETTGQCDWARYELADKMAESMSGPLFAAIVDLTDKLQADPSRVEVEKLVRYLLTVVTDDESLRAVLASAVDVIQVLLDGQTLPPIMNVLSALAGPESTAQADGGSSVSGTADIVLQVLNVLSRDPQEGETADAPLVFDRYRALDHILPNLVKPIDDGGTSKTALEVILDVVADVNRYDSSQDTPLSPDDYRQLAVSARDFMVDPNRGVEQLYTVVRGREGN